MTTALFAHRNPRFGEKSSHFLLCFWFVLQCVYQPMYNSKTKSQSTFKELELNIQNGSCNWWTSQEAKQGMLRRLSSMGRRLTPSSACWVRGCGIQETWQDCLAHVELWRRHGHYWRYHSGQWEKDRCNWAFYLPFCPPVSHCVLGQWPWPRSERSHICFLCPVHSATLGKFVSDTVQQ